MDNFIPVSPNNAAQMGSEHSAKVIEVPFLGQIDLRVDEKHVDMTKDKLGFSLPVKVGESETTQTVVVICIGPDWWHAIGDNCEEIFSEIFSSVHASVVDVSGQRTCIELKGPNALDLLQHGCDLDLDLTMFTSGMAYQGLYAEAPVILHCVGRQTYRMYVRGSFARHVWNFLEDALLEYGEKHA